MLMSCSTRIFFCLSKFPELLDTAFLVIRGKNVLFLHWYHHISVLLYCWYSTQKRYPATAFACINAFVHSVMYYYYFRTAQGIRPDFAKMVTQIQLVQMAMGMGFTALFMVWHYESPRTCNGGPVIHASGLLETSFASPVGCISLILSSLGFSTWSATATKTSLLDTRSKQKFDTRTR